MEPSWYGVPVVFGPCMASQPEMVDLVHEYGSGVQMTEETFESALDELLSNPDKRAHLGRAGLRLVGDMHGATQKTFSAICNKCASVL